MTQPHWIIHSDGRVSEFDRSQIAADLYHARTSHERQGAALFAAELSQAVLHFAAQAFESPVWRSSRLKELVADTLRGLGHAETADAWTANAVRSHSMDRAVGYASDLVGLVEEGVLDFDLRLDELRLLVQSLDALRSASAAESAEEFISGLCEPLGRASCASECVFLWGADLGAAMLHQASERPEEAAVRLREVVSTAARESLSRIVIAVTSELDCSVERRLGGSPLFPFHAPADAAEFHRRLVSILKSDLAVAAEFDGGSVSGGLPIIARIGVRFGGAVDPAGPTPRDVALLDAVVRVAVQRRQALRNAGVVALDDRCAFRVQFHEGRQPEFLYASLHRLAEMHRLTVSFD